MNNVLITIGVLIVAVLSALFAIPYFVDWNSYRGVIEEEASRIVGRDVRIGGEIKLQLLPAPSFVIQKLRVADTASGSGEPLFRADLVDARLSIVPLVRGVLEANQIELVKPVLRLVLDDAGQGNWRSLARGRGSLPFVPSDVALQSVKITDGTFSVFDRGGNRERLSLDRISGQLSAPALEGPYRFRGLFGEGVQSRDLRFTTLPADADGVVQIKVALKDIATSTSVSLDGRLRNLGARPELTGQLSALIPLPRSSAGNATTETKNPVPIADLKANLAASGKQIELNDLSVAFEGSARPEVLAGNAVFSWEGERTTVAKLSAPWIDLDNVLGNPQGGNPLLALGDFAQRINGLATGIGTASAVLEIEQASLGQDVVGGIRVEARSSAGLLAVERLRANLPGGTKVEMQGRISGEGAATTFDGDMTVQGNSLARLAGWASSGTTQISAANDQSFRMRSRVTSEPARGGLRDIRAQIGDATIEGEIDYAWSGARKLRITLDGPRLDARAVAPSTLTLRTLSDFLRPSASEKNETGKAAPLDISVNLKTAELILTEQTLRDVAASVESTARGLIVDRLQFSGDNGVAVALDGRLGRTNQLRGSIAAADLAGVEKLSDFFGFPLQSLVPAGVLPDLLPLRLAGALEPSPDVAGSSVTLTADGRAGQSDAKIKVALSAGVETWRTAPADIDVVLLAPPETQMAAKMLAALRAEMWTAPSSLTILGTSAVTDKPAATTRLAMRAIGIPADGLSTAVRFDSPDLTLYVDGLGHISGAGAVQLSGDVTFDARDARGALDALGGLRLGLSDPLVVQGTTRINARDGGISLQRITAVASGITALSGTLELSPAPRSAIGSTAERRRLEGTMNFSSLDVRTLLAPILQTRLTDTQAAIQVTSGRFGVWPDANFDFSRNAAIDATIKLTAGKLTLADGIGLSKVAATLVNRSGAIEYRDLTGTGLGGRLAGTAVLSGSTSGAVLSANLDFTAVKLEYFGASGTADLAMTLNGTGINPAGLVSALAGSGTLKLGAAEARELTPETLQAAIDTALKAPADKLTGTLRTLLTGEPSRGTITLGPRSIALTLQDGVARTAAVVVPTPGGRIVSHAALDLTTFGMSGDWRIETRMPPLPALPPLPGQPIVPPAPMPATLLPPVVQRFALTPADLDPARKSKRPPPDTDAIEREMAVRKVERDLAELERIRRLDEERAATREREEKAALEAEQARQWETKSTGIPAPEALPARR